MRAFPQATTAEEFPSAAHDALALDGLLTPEERDVRRRVRAFVVSNTHDVDCQTRASSNSVATGRLLQLTCCWPAQQHCTCMPWELSPCYRMPVSCALVCHSDFFVHVMLYGAGI
jgi:hypothetical protein